ncbi:hypothetical protein SLEP1_g53576 [Rubroshorea leprosula]|uniref:RNase H type-1 domain-containing protein n=1 Tax=Rubroshorea leprosula TaxID=152421 RepID=A0AAV5MAS9_9ROSI|nr:hypothetical protein SLEP1_g53576 [Rubroshorea leprosula]
MMHIFHAFLRGAQENFCETYEVLIKSVLQSLPTYLMSLFLLPASLCTDLERIMNRYWWGGGEDEHKIHWMEWKKLATSKRTGGLGFRAMRDFNLAMLGKQGWRLLTYPDSLAARLMKAKYFPRSDLLHAEPKSPCSFTWRSIWYSAALLKQGCRRLIGDGRSTKIWGDPWLSGNMQFYVQSPRPQGCDLRFVSELIDEETTSWRRDLVLETFNAHEAQLILAMPLSWMRREDNWMWHFTKHGNYTIKSGYYRTPVMARSHDGSSASSTLFGGNRIWSLNIPEKVRLLVWSAYQNVIPTKDNLHKKHVDVDLECPLCGVERESVFHCFVSCSLACAVWLGCPLNLRVSELPVDDFANFFDTTASVLGAEQLELRTMHFIKEYRTAILSRGRGAAVVQQVSETRWHPPDFGFIKLNVDGAISVQNRVFGMGALARNHAGEVLAAMACKGQGVVDAEVAEACSLRRALQWAHSLSFRRIVVESNCTTIVSAISNETLKMNSSLGLILLDCKALLASFESCRVQHVRRVGNAAAHELARRALSAEDDEFWVDAILATIMSIVTGDMHHI